MADEYILQIAILTVNINDTYTTTLPHSYQNVIVVFIH